MEQSGNDVAQELDGFTSELATTLAENGTGPSRELKNCATKIEAASHLGSIAEIKKHFT